MRATVLLSEYLVYIPATIVFLRHYGRAQGVGATSHSVAVVAFLMQPATIVIDHGHFQYNTVMLGFVIAALSSIYAGRLMWSCIFFVAALGYKQMSLYYSPIFFAYLLGTCLTPRLRAGRLLGIAAITTLSLAALFIPLILGSLTDANKDIFPPNTTNNTTPALLNIIPFEVDLKSISHQPFIQLAQSIHRIFPFSRGLFEDKVANFWCALNTIYKIRNLSSLIPLPRLSLYLTLVTTLPSFLLVCAIPHRSLLPYALACSAWSFFLFSFQVHEKSVLLPLLPMTLLLGARDGLSRETRAWVGWANMVGTWTLYPLLKRDELRIPYFVLTLLWAYLLGLPPTSLDVYFHNNDPVKQSEKAGAGKDPQQNPKSENSLRTETKILHLAFYAAMILWHVGEAFVPPPQDKPDLWIVLNVCLGATAFGICYLWCTWKLVLGTGLLEEYFRDVKRVERRKLEGSGAGKGGASSEEKKKEKKVQ